MFQAITMRAPVLPNLRRFFNALLDACAAPIITFDTPATEDCPTPTRTYILCTPVEYGIPGIWTETLEPHEL